VVEVLELPTDSDRSRSVAETSALNLICTPNTIQRCFWLQR